MALFGLPDFDLADRVVAFGSVADPVVHPADRRGCKMTGLAEGCAFCGSVDLFPKRQTVAGERWPVCYICASVGRSAWDADPCGAFLCCLHLAAMELERHFPVAHSASRRERRAARGIEAAFSVSAFRQACACSNCAGWRADLDRPVCAGNVFTDIGDGEAPPAFAFLRSLSKAASATGPHGEVVGPLEARDLWREQYQKETAVPDGARERLTALASDVSLPGGFVGFGRILADVAERRAIADDDSWWHWHMVQKYGRGLRDGDFWVGRDGTCVPLDAEDRLRPMTKGDKLALQADRERAATWRRGG